MLYMCPHTTIYASWYLNVCVLTPTIGRQHTSAYVSMRVRFTYDSAAAEGARPAVAHLLHLRLCQPLLLV